MPAKAPPSGLKIEKKLSSLGSQIRAHRKGIKVSAIATAEAAGISRMTLNRIERGEPSVTMGAYLNVISALGLELDVRDPKNQEEINPSSFTSSSKVRVADYPQLKKLAWQLKNTKKVSLQEALNIYERNWRHINLNEMSSEEREFIHNLLSYFGQEKLLV